MDNLNGNQAELNKETARNAKEAGNQLFAQVDSNRSDSLAIMKSAAAPSENNPKVYSTLPPYLLDELAKRNPNNGDILSTRAKTKDLETQGGSAGLDPRATDGEHGSREVYDAKGQYTQPGEKARFEGEDPTGNKAVDEAYDFTGFVRDFYQKEYGRDSIDGKGMKLISTVNYGNGYENAFWNGSQMTYGNPGENSPFKTFVLLDVAGHEITHGVTEKESNERYYGQSGALNESNSDIFGELIQQYSKHQTADQADWLVGDGIWKDKIHGRALRDMLHPGTAYDDPSVGKDPQPADMAHYKKMSGDNGGVHYNSGIPNRAFATFAQAVGGYAWEDPGHIWYAARKAAGSNPSFSQFAYQTIEAAKALGHGDEVEKLQKAWELVGVKPSATAVETLTPPEQLAAEQELKKAS